MKYNIFSPLAHTSCVLKSTAKSRVKSNRILKNPKEVPVRYFKMFKLSFLPISISKGFIYEILLIELIKIIFKYYINKIVVVTLLRIFLVITFHLSTFKIINKTIK